MNREKWKEKYITILMQNGLSKNEAIDNFKAAIDSHDFNDDPEMAALDELSYWSDD